MKKLKLNIQKFAGGEFSLGQNGALQGRIVWSSTSNGAINNNSTVVANLQARRTSYTTYGTWRYALNLDGTYQEQSWFGTVGTDWITIATLTKTKPHNADGSGSCYISAWITGPSGTTLSGVTVSGESTVNLDKIDRFATISASYDFTDEENPTIYFNNPSKVYNLRAKLEAGGNYKLIYRDLPKDATSCTFNLTSEERDKLRALTPNSNTLTVRTTITSMNGETELYSSYVDKTMTIVNANPTFTNFNVVDVNPTTLNLTGNGTVNVNNYSRIRVAINTTQKAVAKKKATISKYRFNDIDIPYSDTETVRGDLLNSPNGTYNVYAIDSRNNSTLVTRLSSKNITYTPLYLDKTNSNVTRTSGGVGNMATLTYKGTIWNSSFGKVTNSIKTATYRFKKTNESTWQTGDTNIKPTLNGNNFSFSGQIRSKNTDYSFDLESSYDIEITITDELSKATHSMVLGSAIPNIAMADNGVGIMGKYDETVGGLLQVGSKQVVESKETSTNGYIKFYDGTLICYGVVSISSPSFVDWYGFCRRTNDISITFPVNFVNTNYRINLTSQNYGYFSGIIQSKSTANFKMCAMTHNNSSYNPSAGNFEYIVIGRWK